MTKTTILILTAAGILAATTLAAPAQARTIEQDLAVAQVYWHSDVCAGEWVVLPDAAGLRAAGYLGQATGLGWPSMAERAWSEGEPWWIERCEFTLDPALTGCQREATIRHEVGHFVNGPSHDGRMAPRVMLAVPCTQPARRHVIGAGVLRYGPAAKRKRSRRCIARPARCRVPGRSRTVGGGR